jgi:DNA-binding transcriptional MerR regulator
MDSAGNGLSVSEAAASVGLTAHTLRWYEQEGLVAPVDRDAAGRRRYRERDLDWLRLLIRLRTTGMPVREMRRYAELVRRGDTTVGERLRMFLDHRERVVARIAELRRDLAVIDTKIEIYRTREREHDEVTTAG